MSGTLDNLLAGSNHPGVTELRAVLTRVLGQGNGQCRLVEQVPLQTGACQVYRLCFDIHGSHRSLVVKKHKPSIAQRNEAVIERWLPAVGLQAGSPQLLGVAAEHAGMCVWHVYEDLGPWALNCAATPQKVQAAVELIAKLHTAFVGHALLAEARLEGGDLGFSFFSASVRDAIRCLQTLDPRRMEMPSERSTLRDRLLERMEHLVDQEALRARLLAECGGPETLLHGDLWTCNTFVRPLEGSFRAWLIDWDHAAVGQVSYDLSTFLLRFPARERRRVLALYTEALSRIGWHLPETDDWNQLFETAELARLANSIIWPALAVLRDPNGWGWDRLADIAQWLDQLKPVLLPEEASCRVEDLPGECSPTHVVQFGERSTKGAPCP